MPGDEKAKFGTSVTIATLMLLFASSAESSVSERKKRPNNTMEIALVGANFKTNMQKPFLVYGSDGSGYKQMFSDYSVERASGAHIGSFDIDRDGRDEIFVGGKNVGKPGGMLHVYSMDDDGKVQRKKIDDRKLWDLTIGDIDGDSFKEVVVTTVGSKPGETYTQASVCLGFYEVSEGIENVTYTEIGPSGVMLYKPDTLQTLDVDADGKDEIISLTGFNGRGILVLEKVGKDGLKLERYIGLDKNRQNHPDVPESTMAMYEIPEGKNTVRLKELFGYDDGADGVIRPRLMAGMNSTGPSKNGDILIGGYDWTAPGEERLRTVADAIGRFQVFRRGDDGKYRSFFLDEGTFPKGSQVWSGCLGDADNDGKTDVVIGSDRVRVFKYDGEVLTEIWQSQQANLFPGVTSVLVGDTDGDGFKEIVASIKKPRAGNDDFLEGEPHGERLAIYGNRGKGTDIELEWESDILGGYFKMDLANFDGK